MRLGRGELRVTLEPVRELERPRAGAFAVDSP